MRENILIFSLLFAAVMVCYAGVLNAGFVWDDEYLVLQNPLIRAPIWSFQIFRQDIVNSNFTYTIYYRPIQILSYAIDYRLRGIDPATFHFSSIFLHFLNGILVFLLAQKLVREKTIAFLTAVFFVVHPAQVAAVSYISSRADLLFFFFGFLSMLLYVLSRETKQGILLAASVFSFVLSLLSKEAALIFPFLILLVDTALLRKDFGFKITRHIPYFVIAGVYLALHRLIFGGRYLAVFRPGELAGSFLEYLRMAGEFFTLGIIPFALQIRRGAGEAGFPLIIFILAGLFVILALILIKRDRKTLLFSLGFFMIALFPLVFVVKHFKIFAEHWIYLASFGVFLFLSVVVRRLCGEKGIAGRAALTVIVFGAVFFYSSRTIGQNIFWQSDVGLSDRVLASSARDTAAMHFKALAYLKKGKKVQSLDIMDEFAKYNKQSPRTWYLKGRLTLAAGNTDEAERDFKKAVSINPDYENGYLGLALVAFAKGEQQKGTELLERAAEINPGYSDAFLLLTAAYLRSDEREKAFAAAKKAKEINPYDYNSIINLGTAYTRRGDLQKGALLYLEASRLYPERPDAYYNLGQVFYVGGRREEAQMWLRKAVMVDPDFRPATELLRKMRNER
ncbi:MAG: tetratricopeptide repeat protein [Candidatus Omnitrophota bacterium]